MAHCTKFSVSVTSEACIAAAVILLAVPLPWVVAWSIAAGMHEVCHIAMLRLCGKSVEQIYIGLHGAKIHTQVLTDGETVLCTLAGPVGGLLLLLFARYLPKIAICALLQSSYNLLPVFPLDGGRALRSLLRIVFPLWLADRICKITEVTMFIIFLILGCVATFVWKLRIMPVIFAVIFMLHTKKRKISCK